MPNTFAYIALIIWPFISLLFYKRLTIITATFLTIVGGFLILPVKVAIDFPFIPPLDKESIPVIAAFIGCVLIKNVKIKLLPKAGIERWLVLLLLIIPFFTMLNNQESYNFIPGLTLHDTFSSILNNYLKLLPFIIGLQLIKTHEEQVVLLKLLVVAALLYSMLILFEVRMSPQLHTWIYGFFPHTFSQQARFGGFRPVVFLGHGLIVAMFVAVTLGASTILLKQKIKVFRVSPWLITIYFIVLLLLSKTFGAFLLGLFLFTAIIWMPVNMIKKMSMLLVFIVLLYPLLSIFDFFPHQQLIQMATDFEPERGQSLGFRFRHENLLLEHAQQKMFFGWGSWGRNRLDDSVTDGYWIIIYGQYGLFGFLSLFGLLAVSVWKTTKVSRLVKDKNKLHIMFSHALIVSVIMVDQLPNASLAAWMFFLTGALLGRTNNIKFEKNV